MAQISVGLQEEVVIHNLVYGTDEACDEVLDQAKEDVKALGGTEYLERLR